MTSTAGQYIKYRQGWYAAERDVLSNPHQRDCLIWQAGYAARVEEATDEEKAQAYVDYCRAQVIMLHLQASRNASKLAYLLTDNGVCDDNCLEITDEITDYIAAAQAQEAQAELVEGAIISGEYEE